MKPNDLCKFRFWTGVILDVFVSPYTQEAIAKVRFVKHQYNAFEYLLLSELQPATPEEIEAEKEYRRQELEKSLSQIEITPQHA